MSFNATLVYEEVLTVVTPLGVKPIASILHDQVFPVIPNSTNIQIYVLMGILGCQLIAFLISLNLRAFRSKDFWLVHFRKTPRGTYIAPNFSICWQIGLVMLSALLQPYCYLTIRHNEGHDVTDYLAWRGLIWIASFFAPWVAMWALCVVDAISAPGSDTRFISHPIFLNTIFPLSLGAVIAMVVPVVLIMSHRFDSMMEAFARSEENLFQLSTLYTDLGSEAAQQALQAQIPVTQEAFYDFDRFITSFQTVWVVWTVIAILLACAFLSVFVRQYRRVRAEHSDINSDSGNRIKRVALKDALRNLYLSSVVVTIMCVNYSGLCLFLASDPVLAVTSVVALQVETLFAMYNFGVFCSLAAVLVLVKAIQTPPAGGNATSTGGLNWKTHASQVKVTNFTSTQFEVDSQRRQDIFELNLRDPDLKQSVQAEKSTYASFVDMSDKRS